MKFHLYHTSRYDLKQFASKMIAETSYLDLNTVLSMWFPDNVYSEDIFAYVLRMKPTIQTLQSIKAHLDSINWFDSAAPRLLDSALQSKNEELVIAIWEQSKMIDLDSYSTEILSEMKNVELIERIAQKLASENLYHFYFSLLEKFANTNNFELFQIYFDKVELRNVDVLYLMKEAILNGAIDAVKLCMKKHHYPIDLSIWSPAYRSGNLEMVNLIKSFGQSPDLKPIASRFFGILFRNGLMITFQAELLRELLSVHVISRETVQGCIENLVRDYDNLYNNVNDEIFRIFAELAPDITLKLDYIQKINLPRMLLCLKYFKKVQIPLGLNLSQQQLVELIESGTLESSQIPEAFGPLLDIVDWRTGILERVHIKRTVYLFFSSETELRDNAELILEYI